MRGKWTQGFLALFLTLLCSHISKASTLKVLRVKPTGKDVPVQKQIVFTFNRDVVPIGRMERSHKEVPITITPKLNCQWRWIDRANLACQLTDKKPTQKATEYKIVMRPGITAEDGATIDQPFTHIFSTERPKIYDVNFKHWLAPGHPVMRIAFNQPVTKKSVAIHIDFSSDSKPHKAHKVKIMPDLDQHTHIFVKGPNDKSFVHLGLQDPLEPNGKPKKYKGEVAQRIWFVEPLEELPLNTEIDLLVHPGIESALGLLKSTEGELIKHFHTFPDFAFMGI